MKKIKSVILLFFISFIMVSCGNFNERKTPDNYEKYTLTETSEDLRSAINDVESSVVSIAYIYRSQGRNYQGITSGFVYKESNGYYYATTVLDDYIKAATSYYVYFEDDTYVNATRIGYDSYNYTIAFRFATTKDITPSVVESEYTSNIGDRVFSISTMQELVSIGSSQAIDLDLFDNYDTSFMIYSGVLSRYDGYEIQHTAMSTSLHYGSALFDFSGKLIGMNYGKIDKSWSDLNSNGEIDTSEEDSIEFINGLNFALANNTLYTSLNDIEDSVLAGVQRVNFGCSFTMVYTIEGALIQVYELPDGIASAVCVHSISSSSDFRDLKENDLITSINGIDVTGEEILKQVFYLSKYSDTITLTVYRLVNNEFKMYTITNR